MNLWNLIATGQFHEAIEEYTLILRNDPNWLNHANRGTAYLNIGDYESALADFQAAHQTQRVRSDGYLQAIGACHWLAGRKSEAATVWHDLVLATERGKIDYSDAAGGVESGLLLWFAAVRLGRDELLTPARRLLEKKAKPKKRIWMSSIENWPGPVALFLLGRITENDLRSRISTVPVLRDRHVCKAEFYIGVRKLQAGNSDLAKSAFQKAADMDLAILENELYLAREEGKPFISPISSLHPP